MKIPGTDISASASVDRSLVWNFHVKGSDGRLWLVVAAGSSALYKQEVLNMSSLTNKTANIKYKNLSVYKTV